MRFLSQCGSKSAKRHLALRPQREETATPLVWLKQTDIEQKGRSMFPKVLLQWCAALSSCATEIGKRGSPSDHLARGASTSCPYAAGPHDTPAEPLLRHSAELCHSAVASRPPHAMLTFMG
ncbi:hypothetical protein DPEC_G00340260 [Dallia pectoralis]|uniref:Uncharacterized protein n=1 Tax=Dallia pectoralis TaxID=75939 RepID=A0ACC2F543_DALPE|nr:hypothetical protein DPEC_G00340260 [Dallia pectoralis]